MLEVGELMHTASAARQEVSEQLQAETSVCSVPAPVVLEESDLGELSLLALNMDNPQ